MSTAIGVILFIIGAGSLVASVVMDRRPAPSATRGDEPVVPDKLEADADLEAAATSADVPEPIEAEVEAASVEGEPGPERAEPERAEPERAEPETQSADVAEAEPIARPEAVLPSAADRASAAEARLATLRAELTGGALEPGTAPEQAPPEASQAEQPLVGIGHTHAVPVVSHSDLVTHMRSEHPDLESGGSTIQMRLLHERAHAD